MFFMIDWWFFALYKVKTVTYNVIINVLTKSIISDILFYQVWRCAGLEGNKNRFLKRRKAVMKKQTMYDSKIQFAGISLEFDPINRERVEEDDNVMAIFPEEQPFTWEFAQPYIKQALAQSSGELDFLDVGTGSGVFGILMAKHYGARVLALDKNPRAIELAKKNAENNHVFLAFQEGEYAVHSVQPHSVKVIGLYPPYHIYPEQVAMKIPQHARGGSDGQQEFKNQLFIAGHHLAENGIIFFNQMCLGDESGPSFTRYIPQLVSGHPSLLYTNVFTPISTWDFLQNVYGKRHAGLADWVATENPLLYYTIGIVTYDGQGKIERVPHAIDLTGRSWQDRIQLHAEIARHAFSEGKESS